MVGPLLKPTPFPCPAYCRGCWVLPVETLVWSSWSVCLGQLKGEVKGNSVPSFKRPRTLKHLQDSCVAFWQGPAVLFLLVRCYVLAPGSPSIFDLSSWFPKIEGWASGWNSRAEQSRYVARPEESKRFCLVCILLLENKPWVSQGGIFSLKLFF